MNANPFAEQEVRLRTGDPQRTDPSKSSTHYLPGSYSRFVLPIPYSLRPAESPRNEEDFCWVEAKGEDWIHTTIPGAPGFGRRDFVTRETHAILHERAKWFVLRGQSKSESRTIDFSSGTSYFTFDFFPDAGRKNAGSDRPRAVPVCVRPPALVLFEWPESGHSRRSPSEGNDLLQIGFVIFETYFQEQEGCPVFMEDILALNEYFRYCQRNFNPWNWLHAMADMPVRFSEAAETVGKLGLVKDSNTGKVNPSKGAADLIFERWNWLVQRPLHAVSSRSAQAWFQLQPLKEEQTATQWAKHRPSFSQEDPGWLLHADNRSFVWTCAIADSPALLDRIQSHERPATDDPWEGSGLWIKLLNVDLPPSNSGSKRLSIGACTPFERQWVSTRTYLRWAHSGVLYGFNVHSGALLSASEATVPIWRHFGDHYFDQLLLLLYLRTALFAFSWRLFQLTAQVRDKGGEIDLATDDFQREFESLRHDFALFTNLYQFPLISNQQQGLEIYALLRRQLDVEDLFEELASEIHQSDEFLAAYRGRRQSDAGLNLSAVGTLTAVVFVATSLLGSGPIIDRFKEDQGGVPLWLVFVAFAFGFGIVYFAIQLAQPITRWMHRSAWRRVKLSRKKGVKGSLK